MFPAGGFASARQQDLQDRARQDRQVRRLRTLERASRRAARAEQRMTRALYDAMRARDGLDAGS